MIFVLTIQTTRGICFIMNTNRYKQITVFRGDADRFTAIARRERRTFAAMFAVVLDMIETRERRRTGGKEAAGNTTGEPLATE